MAELSGAQQAVSHALKSVISRALFAILMTLPMASVAPASATDKEPDRQLRIEVRDGLLSVSAVDVPLEDVLREVGKKAGFQLHLAGGLRHVGHEEFTNLPFPDALRRLAGHNGLIMIYGHDKADRQSRLQEVRVYSELLDIRRAEKTKSKTSSNAPLHVVDLMPPGATEWPSPEVLGLVSSNAAKMPTFRVPKASRIPKDRYRN